MASRQSNCAKKLKLETDTLLHETAVTSEAGFIVIDLETDGLIKKSKEICTWIPQILQIGFAPLERLASATTTISFYVEPMDSVAFRMNLKGTPFLQKFYRSYSGGSYLVKREGKSDQEVHAIPLITCIDILIRWKQELYKDRPVYFIAHNALKFDKIVLEYNLKKLKMFPSFQSQINFAGWIDSLSIIRGIPNILQVLGYPYMTEESKKWLIWQERPFSQGKLIEALSRRYAQLSLSKSSLQWPVLQLSYFQRTEKEEKWLFYFSRDDMIRNCKDVLKELTFHQAGDDVTGLVCILHQLNLYPKFRNAHFKRDYNVIIP